MESTCLSSLNLSQTGPLRQTVNPAEFKNTFVHGARQASSNSFLILILHPFAGHFLILLGKS